MIEHSVRIHDRHQAEIKLDYRMNGAGARCSYEVALYFFVPPSLGLNPRTFGKREFFADLIDRVRIKTPSVILRNILDPERGPFRPLEGAMRRLVDRKGPAPREEYEHHLKMFCCIFKSALRDHVHLIDARSKRQDVIDLVEQFVLTVGVIPARFRELRHILNVPTVEAKAFARYQFADEFLSIALESYACEMAQKLARFEGPDIDDLRKRLLAIVRGEVQYRQENGYASILDERSDNEILVFRRSVLKKFVESALFLTTRARREGKLTEQALFAFAAGCSMVFATAVAFLVQQRFGNLTLPLFVALVASYMLKDRLKEWLRVAFDSKVRRRFADRRLLIYGTTGKRPIGVCRETFDFLTDQRLPPSIAKLRNRDHLTEIENGWLGETVFRYRKHIQMVPNWLERLTETYPVDGLNNIMRLSFSRYLPRMDDPRKPLWVSDGETVREVDGERVYHINLILECAQNDEVEYGRFRVVLNKDGIKRIETVRAETVVVSHGGPRPGLLDEDSPY